MATVKSCLPPSPPSPGNSVRLASLCLVPMRAPLASLYRLFLRTTTSSVLYHKVATLNLKSLYRFEFRNAAASVKKLEAATTPQTHLQARLQQWNERGTYARLLHQYPHCFFNSSPYVADNTLALLYNSSLYRGLPHRLTHNLALFVLGHHQRRRFAQKYSGVWKANLPANSPEYKLPQVRNLGGKRSPRQQGEDALNAGAFNALDEVVRLAEGRNKIFMGRMTTTRRKLRS